LEGNDRLESLLTEVLESSEAASTLANDLGVEGDDTK